MLLSERLGIGQSEVLTRCPLDSKIVTFVLVAISAGREASPPCPSQRGGERGLVNELFASFQFRERRRWRWSRPGHINVLELRSLLAMLTDEVRAGRGDRRLTAAVDSRVASSMRLSFCCSATTVV